MHEYSIFFHSNRLGVSSCKIGLDCMIYTLRAFLKPKSFWGRSRGLPPPCRRGHPSHTHPSAFGALHLRTPSVLDPGSAPGYFSEVPKISMCIKYKVAYKYWSGLKKIEKPKQRSWSFKHSYTKGTPKLYECKKFFLSSMPFTSRHHIPLTVRHLCIYTAIIRYRYHTNRIRNQTCPQQYRPRYRQTDRHHGLDSKTRMTHIMNISLWVHDSKHFSFINDILRQLMPKEEPTWIR